MEAARGEGRQVDERAEAVMEIAARRAPWGRRAEPNVAAQQVKVGIGGIAQGGATSDSQRSSP
jgi:hypothetical protein